MYVRPDGVGRPWKHVSQGFSPMYQTRSFVRNRGLEYAGGDVFEMEFDCTL
jgi:hypothetical protein